MKSTVFVASALLALSAVSCSSVRPVAIHEGDQCYRCRRSISDTKVAGELVDPKFVSKFRSPACMAKYLVEHPEETGKVFVTDYSTGSMFSPTDAFFVPIVNRDNGERDFRAYKDKADADAAAAQTHTELVGWKTVLDNARS